ncbi:MAG: hypothetical protein L0Y44_02920 [Phycisphaerales bacterium]|nr:hypothetical protein [Phycisphaerales bacterium]
MNVDHTSRVGLNIVSAWALELYAGYCLWARFAPQREHSIDDLIANGIALATEFMFIEDPYLIAARPIHAAPVSKLLAAKTEGPKLQNPVRGASGLERGLQLTA